MHPATGVRRGVRVVGPRTEADRHGGRRVMPVPGGMDVVGLELHAILEDRAEGHVDRLEQGIDRPVAGGVGAPVPAHRPE